MGVIGLSWQSICHGTEQEHALRKQHPGLHTPSQFDLFAGVKHNLCGKETWPFKHVKATSRERKAHSVGNV